MQAYKDALPADTTRVLLSPNSEFFRYFGQAPNAASHAAATPARKRK
jgi:hypothetical protein